MTSTLYIFLSEFCNILTHSRLQIAKAGLKSHLLDLQTTVGQKIMKIWQKNVQSRGQLDYSGILIHSEFHDAL